MRLVAVFLVALMSLAATVGASDHKLNDNDDCHNQLTPTSAGNSCLRLGNGLLPAKVSPTSGHVFLWLGVLDCSPSPSCVSVGGLQSRNHVTGQAAIFGLLYTDSNDLAGLQRFSGTYGGIFRSADNVLLV